MRRISQIFYSFKEYLVLLLTLSAALVLMSFNESRQVDVLRMRIVATLSPLQQGLSWISKFRAIEKENKKLRQQSVWLAYENSIMREALLENRRLRRMLGFKENSPYRLLAAEVIGRRSDGVTNSIIINLGKQESLKEGFPVVTHMGLVGKIISVGENKAIGQLLSDRNFRVSAVIQRSRALGIVHPYSEEILFLKNVPKRSDVKIGDVVVTSGYSEIFPPGIKVGLVTEVSEEEVGLFKRITLKPSANLVQLEEVFVIANEKQ